MAEEEEFKLPIKKIEDTLQDSLKCIIYAPSGSGKTSLLGTLDEDTTLIISAESGLLSIKGKKHDVIEVKSMAQLRKVYDYLASGKSPYKNVALDSLSEISRIHVAELEAIPEFKDPKNTFKMWGVYDKRMRSIVTSFRDLKGINVFFTALVEDVSDGGIIIKKPAIKGSKLQGELISYFDEVFYIEVDAEGNRFVRHDSTNIYEAKDRSNGLPEEIMFKKDSTDMLEQIKAWASS